MTAAVRWTNLSGRRTSWHLLREDGMTTICGRGTPRDRSDYRPEFPGNEKTCERCAVLGLKATTPTPDFQGVPI